MRTKVSTQNSMIDGKETIIHKLTTKWMKWVQSETKKKTTEHINGMVLQYPDSLL